MSEKLTEDERDALDIDSRHAQKALRIIDAQAAVIERARTVLADCAPHIDGITRRVFVDALAGAGAPEPDAATALNAALARVKEQERTIEFANVFLLAELDLRRAAEARAEAAEKRSPLGLSFERIEELKVAESEAAGLRASLVDTNAVNSQLLIENEALRAEVTETHGKLMQARENEDDERGLRENAESRLAEARALLVRCKSSIEPALCDVPDDIDAWLAANPEVNTEPECPYCVGHLCPEHQPLNPEPSRTRGYSFGTPELEDGHGSGDGEEPK